MRTLPVQEIQNIEGQVMRVPRRDADGEVVWRDRCGLCDQPANNTVPELEPLTTIGAIRMLIFSVPAEVRKAADPENAYRVMQAVRNATKKEIILEDSDYEFIDRLMDRPVGEPGDDPGNAETQTMGTALWGMNAYAVRQQLTPGPVDMKVVSS